MDKIINILLLVIIFVFDPLAISLVVAANFAFDKAYPKRKENLYGEELEEEFIEEETYETSPNPFPPDYTEEDEKRMDIIGQNGNEGEHYDKLDINKDGKVDIIDKEISKRRINEITSIIDSNSLTQETRKNLIQEKRLLENKLDELTKIY